MQKKWIDDGPNLQFWEDLWKCQIKNEKKFELRNSIKQHLFLPYI